MWTFLFLVFLLSELFLLLSNILIKIKCLLGLAPAIPTVARQICHLRCLSIWSYTRVVTFLWAGLSRYLSISKWPYQRVVTFLWARLSRYLSISKWPYQRVVTLLWARLSRYLSISTWPYQWVVTFLWAGLSWYLSIYMTIPTGGHVPLSWAVVISIYLHDHTNGWSRSFELGCRDIYLECIPE